MNIVDANVLLYAVNEDARQHELARSWLDRALGGTESTGFAWIALIAFLRVSTSQVFSRPYDPAEAIEVVETWLGAPSSVIVEPTARHLALLSGLLAPLGSAANLVNDAHLAVLAVEHGGRVISFDHDFGRFPGVSWGEPE